VIIPLNGKLPMKLKLSEMSHVAEIIGAFAIVLSLVYVGVQVKDSAAATRSAAVNDASESVQLWYLEMGSNRQASDLWFSAMTSSDPISTNDEFQFMMMMHACMLGFQKSYLLVEEGTLDADYRDSITFALVAVKDLPGMHRYWRQRRGFLHRGFAEYVDGLFLRDSVDTLDMYKRSENEPDK
jgi:hypothetical protein